MKRYIPILLIITLMIVAWFFGAGEWFTFSALREHRQFLQLFVSNNPITAPFIFIVIYITATALSIPGAIFLTLSSGFLFPQPWATFYVVVAATVGATFIFLAAKTAFGNALRRQAGGSLERMRAGFEENAVNYLLFLRFVPLFPFWLVNLAPAFFEVSLFTFVWTTFLGIIPGSFAFTQAGTGLGAIFDSGEELNLANLFNKEIKIALIALGIVVLLPLLIKKLRK